MLIIIVFPQIYGLWWSFDDTQTCSNYLYKALTQTKKNADEMISGNWKVVIASCLSRFSFLKPP